MRFLSKITFFYLLVILVFTNKIILPPEAPSSTAVALIFFQATNFSSNQYVSLLKEVQSLTSLPLWVGISDFFANLPDPLTVSSQISDILSQMKSSGMPNPSKTFMLGMD